MEKILIHVKELILGLTHEEQLELMNWMVIKGMDKPWPRGTWLQRRMKDKSISTNKN